MHLNVRSLVNKWDNLKTNFIDSGIHILTFSETWFKEFYLIIYSNLYMIILLYAMIESGMTWMILVCHPRRVEVHVCILIIDCNFLNYVFPDIIRQIKTLKGNGWQFINNRIRQF